MLKSLYAGHQDRIVLQVLCLKLVMLMVTYPWKPSDS